MIFDNDTLDFVTVDGLLAYGEVLAGRSPVEGIQFPALPGASMDRTEQVHKAIVAIRGLVQQAQTGFRDAAAYYDARQALIHQACGGDDIVFFAAWNQLLAQGELSTLYHAPIGATQKPIRRRPVAIVPRPQMTPELAEGRIVLDIGDDRFWLMPRDLHERTLFLTMRHGISQVDSKKCRVGRRLRNVLGPQRGIPKADAIGAALARTVGLVEKQLDFLQLHNYLDASSFVHMVSHSPNTRQLFERVVSILDGKTTTTKEPITEQALGIPGLWLGYGHR